MLKYIQAKMDETHTADLTVDTSDKDVVDNLIDILESIGYPVYRQGSMSDEESYPETFITFWNYDTPNHAFYSNQKYGTEANYNIYVYSSDPEKVYEVLTLAKKELECDGWIIQGNGFDVSSDIETHTGRGVNIINMKF